MPNEKILEKIQKILALTASDNPQEAAAAAAMASKLLLKYNLDLRDVIQDKREQDYVRQDVRGEGKAYQWVWRRQLAAVVAKANFCDVLYTEYPDAPVRNTMHFIGQPHNLDVAIYLYVYLGRSIEALAAREWKAGPRRGVMVAWKRAFAEGAILMVQRRLRKMYQEAETVNRETRALVVSNQQALKTAIRQHFPMFTQPQKRKFEGDLEALALGWQHGERIPLHYGLPEEDEVALLQ